MGCWTPVERFAIDGEAEWQARLVRDDGSEFVLLHLGREIGVVRWEMLGRHNVMNGLAALASAHTVGVDLAAVIPALVDFVSVKRRLENLGSARGKANAVERMAPLIAEIANPVARAHYIQALARLVRTDERLVAEQVAQMGRQTDGRRKAEDRPGSSEDGKPMTTGVKAAPSPASRGRSGLEEYMLGWLFLRPDLLPQLDADMIGQQTAPLGPDDFSRAENRALLAALQDETLASDEFGPEERLAGLPDVIQEQGRAVVGEAQRKPSLPDEKLIKDLGDSLLRLRERNLRSQIEQVKAMIQESDEAGAPAGEDADNRLQARQLHELMAVYTAQKLHIHKLLDVRSMAGALAKAQAERKV
jgi:DNA primase